MLFGQREGEADEMSQKIQRCTECDQPTGRCEEDEMRTPNGDGPYCEECWSDLDICGLCGLPGADKFAHPVHWPGEQIPDSILVHAECESAECRRAHAALSDGERQAFLRNC